MGLRGNKKDGLRTGYTTGACAAAAAKAALAALLSGSEQRNVIITLPGGERVSLPVKSVEILGTKAVAAVVKDAGDDPDVTHGLPILAEVELTEKDIEVEGGKGVGRVTKPGLAAPVGGPAINPVPLKMIRDEIKDILPAGKGARVIISAPGGEKLAEKTLNPKLGIIGGISILGTSGIVRPMSLEAYLDSLVPQIDQARALGYQYIIFTPGGMGEKMAKEKGVDSGRIVQTSNFIGEMLLKAVERDIRGVILFGHIGKLVKIAAGIYNTHSRVADARREILAAYAALAGVSRGLVKDIMEANTAEDAVSLIIKEELQEVFYKIAEKISEKALEHSGDSLQIGTVLYSLKGDILGFDKEAVRLGGIMGWEIK